MEKFEWNWTLGVAMFLVSCSLSQRAEIMSYEEYNEVDVRAPYILFLSSGDGRLCYFGAEHSIEIDRAQVGMMQRLWQEFRPTVGFSEGGVWPLEETLEEAVARHGESGLVRFLAYRDSIAVRSLEPARPDEVADLLKHFPAEKVKLFYALRQVTQHRRMNDPEPLEEYVDGVLKNLSGISGLEGAPRSVFELDESYQRNFPSGSTWRDVSSKWFDPTRSDEWTNEVNKRSSRFRDEYMIRLLLNEVRRGERVFAVVGFSHVVMQERALRAELD